MSMKLFGSALLAVSIIIATPALAQSADASVAAPSQAPLQLFVTLPIKPDHLDRFLATMHKEVAGARSEAGNIAFDVYEDVERPGILYLFEHWVSAADLDAHTEQPYYKAIRDQEADDLAGTVGERELLEVFPPSPVAGSQTSGAYTLLTLIQVTSSTRADLMELFTEMAPDIRVTQGNRGFSLYQDKGKPLEFLLIEHWTEQSTRNAGILLPSGRQFQASLDQLTTAPVQQKHLVIPRKRLVIPMKRLVIPAKAGIHGL